MNRCERVAILLTQDCKVSKKGYFAASSQRVFEDEICDCTFVWVRRKIVAAVRREKAFLYRLAFHKLKRLFFFARRRPFLPSHNLLSTKEYSCSFNLRSKSLRCNAGTSHRFKAFSPPFCTKNQFRHVPPEAFPKSFPAEL